MSSATVVIRRRAAFSVVPDAILEHVTLSHASVRALAWALGRPDGWELRIAVWCRACCISPKLWRRVRKELIAAGYFKQTRQRGLRSRIKWINELHDEPVVSTMCPVGTHGGGTHALGTYAQGANYHQDVNQTYTPPPPPCGNLPSGGGGDPDDWKAALEVEREWAVAAGQQIKNPAAWTRAVQARYRREGGPQPEVLAELARRQGAAERRAAQEAVRPPAAPPASPEVASRGLARAKAALRRGAAV